MRARRFSDSLFKGRQITVFPKRKNVHGQGAHVPRGGSGNMAQGRAFMQMAGLLTMMMGGQGARGMMNNRRGGRGGFRPY